MPRKITIIASCLVLVLYSGCVSQDKYGKLETEHNSTQTQMEEDKENLIKLQAQNKQLLSENQRLLKTIDELNLKLDSEKSADEQTEKIISKTAPSTDESGSYSILLSSCQLQESVQKVLSNYKETDLEPFVVKVDLGEKGIWWRIFSGHFATRESANDEKDNSGLSDKIVLKATQADSTLAHDDENETVNNDSLLVKREL